MPDSTRERTMPTRLVTKVGTPARYCQAGLTPWEEDERTHANTVAKEAVSIIHEDGTIFNGCLTSL